MRVLWLVHPNFSGGLQYLLERYIQRAGIPVNSIKFKHATPGMLKKKNSREWEVREEKREQFNETVLKYNPDLIVVNDRAALGYITNKYTSLALTRGSVYKWKGINCIVVDEVRTTKISTDGHWIFLQDMHKIRRWMENAQRPQPKFDYTVCRSIQDVHNLRVNCRDAVAIACDIETSGYGERMLMNCIGYTCLSNTGRVHTWVVPFVNPCKPDACHWESSDEEIDVWENLKVIHQNNTPKIFQNGAFDNTHFILHRLPMRNVFLDTMHMMHSIWPDTKKRLDFIASIACDFYCYWKDETKEDEKSEKDVNFAVPADQVGIEKHWLYNALDCYNTLMSCMFLTKPLVKLEKDDGTKWAIENYRTEIKQQFGPAMMGSLRGMKVNSRLQSWFNEQLIQKAHNELQILRVMAADPDFNPNSPAQVCQVIYDILGGRLPKRQKKKTTDEKILKLVATQNPFLDKFIKQVWAAKKPANNASKYGQLQLFHNRFMYKLAAAGTKFGRYSSAKSNVGLGTNAQNMPKEMRVMVEADPDWVMFDFDFSQSDAYFTAFESQDEKFIKTMLSDKDTHCIHAEHFFKIPYDKIFQGKKNDEEWVTHPLRGVRNITKRIVYGANYLMAAYTLFITMGKEPVVAAAKQLGYEDADAWDETQLVYLCGKFLEAYYQLYDQLLSFITEEAVDTKNKGNLATCFGGKTYWFFGDIVNDNKAQREFASFWGQGGTAGNINRTTDSLFYELENNPNIMFFVQVHDSIVGQVHKDHLHLLKELHSLMERPCTIRGRKFTVPVEGEVGIGWGKRMIDWHPDITYEEISNADQQWWEKWQNGKFNMV